MVARQQGSQKAAPWRGQARRQTPETNKKTIPESQRADSGSARKKRDQATIPRGKSLCRLRVMGSERRERKRGRESAAAEGCAVSFGRAFLAALPAPVPRPQQPASVSHNRQPARGGPYRRTCPRDADSRDHLEQMTLVPAHAEFDALLDRLR